MNTKLPALEMNTKTGDEPFQEGGKDLLDGKDLPLTLLSYWRWSGSDLISNAQRGILAEYLVGSALEMTESVRLEWDAYDIQTPSGLKVEVKTSAYIQSWKQTDYSAISFDIAPKTSWDARDNTFDDHSRRSADVYVFCLLAHKDQETINPLNVDQWEFYVLATSKLDEHCPTQKSIRLAPLKELGPEQPSYATLSETVERVGKRFS